MKFKKNNISLLNTLILSFILVTIQTGCSSLTLMNPKGQIGIEQRSLILTALGLMLLIVIPTIIMTIIFIIKYRQSNIKAIYDPNFHHSNKIEIVVWTIPVIIIAFLAILTWKSTYKLDPSMPIDSKNQPITIEVIALDWKWLFIYPKQGIATINEIVFPINVPIVFHITSNSVMNSFFIPQLGGQIYAMAGMNSKLNLIANEPGHYKGMSSNFSGKGFSGMKFIAVAVRNEDEFNVWINKVKSSPKKLDVTTYYTQLIIPSEYHSVEYFSNVEKNMFQSVIDQFKIKEFSKNKRYCIKQ